MKKLLAMLIVVSLFSSMFLLVAKPTAATNPETDPMNIDLLAPNYKVVNDLGALEPRTHHSAWNVGDQAYWLILDDYYGVYRLSVFTLRMVGPNTEIWVQNNLKWPTGDPRVPNPPIILDTELAYLMDQFENNIYPTDTAYFGDPAPRDGTNAALPGMLGLPSDYYAEGNNKNVILVSNIRDANYYIPTYPNYVAGFFSSTFDDFYFDRNIISIDSYRWERRLGPAGTVWITGEVVNRPFVYESTIAHEYQHLIHHDWNPADPSFMNEGCSMYAEYLCGYGIDPSYLNAYFFTPSDSLTEWGDMGGYDILADYGESALWVIYLSDHYGGSALVSHFVRAGVPGIDGVNAALAYFGYTATFDTVFHDWRIANLVRATDGGLYGYTSINLNDPSINPINMYEVAGNPVPWTSVSEAFRPLPDGVIADNGYPTGVSLIGTYGTDYLKFTDWTQPEFIGFNGDDTARLGWTMTADGWWSGLGNMINVELISQAVTVNPADPTLTLVTKYGIETNWDFGFVQVSTDNGATWTSLSNSYTTSEYLTDVQAIVNNLPGLTDYNPDWPNFTTMTFDLSPYAGQTVLINFRYMTDEATNYEGWFINTATVSGTTLTLTPYPPYPPASYEVTALKVVVTPRGNIVYTTPEDLTLNTSTWEGEYNTYAKNPTYFVLIVSPVMQAGLVDYQFRVYHK